MELRDILKEPQIIWLVYTDNFFYGAYSSVTKALTAIKNYVHQDIEDEDLAESIIAELQARSEQTPEEFHYESYITVESAIVDEGIE